MQPDVKTQWDQVEAAKQALVERVQALPEAQRNQKPDPKSFSPIEVLMHMALAEEVDLLMMDQRPPSSFAGRRAKPSLFFRWGVKSMWKAKSMPTAGQMVPKPGTTFEDACQKWEEVRTRTAAHLDGLPSLEAPACKHPFFGLMSAGNLIELFEAHTHYHNARFPGQ